MKRLLTFPFLLIALSTTVAHAADPVEIDRVVAVVNEGVITQSELDKREALVGARLKAQGVALPPADVLKKQVLDRLVLDSLQIQYAKSIGITATDADIDQAIANIAAQNNTNVDDMRRKLASDGMSFEGFRKDIAKQIILSRLRDREIMQKITVTKAEVDSLLKRYQGGETSYDLAHILIAIPESATPEQISKAKAKAEKAEAEIRSGKNFSEVAASYSEAPDALQGGDIGWRPVGRLPELFVNAVAPLGEGDVTPVLKSPSGFHIVKILGKRGKDDKPVMVEQYHVRHILVRVDDKTPASEAKRKIEEVHRKLVDDKADFAEMARLYSDDSSATKGGDIGWVSPGQTVPQFEAAVKELKVGDISGPVRSPFGYHLIEVLEVREQDVSDERRRQAAEQELRERKADQDYLEWLRQLRDRSFVEYRAGGD